MFEREEKPMVMIKCGKVGQTRTFTILKPILIKHSKFFDKCLRNPCKESESLTIEFPEVRPSIMMLYLTLATRQALINPNSENKKPLVEPNDFKLPTGISSHIQFYQLCDYLQNHELATSVQKMILDYLNLPEDLDDETEAPAMFSIYGRSFDLLEPGHIVQAKIRRALVKSFCLFVNVSMYFKRCSDMQNHPDFLMEISKQYVLNAMWSNPAQRSAAMKIKTQRMLVDDESEPEAED
ncbi:hypothetical protein CGCS363_v009871 [Colletotrichum siamense]|uniref:uncharacterized protein n=1 Tax=Colletotrichum siamense TaxID=690259 RepID=UPI001873344A|nr:uncharacterized protein CGCS363_v009871 [Colletotrichum siamense]KAF5494835.1 hypothetical protein CGCS363_v009871 [Colletotrichum siamense]